MIYNAYSTFDRKALTYNPPFFASTDGAAARSFGDVANDTNHPIGAHPSDYVLYCIGTYDDQKGTLEPVSPLRHVMDAISLVQLQPELFSARANAFSNAGAKANGSTPVDHKE